MLEKVQAHESSKKPKTQQGEEGLDQEIKSVLARIGVLPNCMLSKTSMCNHKYGCYENVIIGFSKLLYRALAIKLLFNNVALLTNPKKLL